MRDDIDVTELIEDDDYSDFRNPDAYNDSMCREVPTNEDDYGN